MPKGKRSKDTNNDGRDGRGVEETRQGRMRMFDQLPKALRQFLANDAAYDHAVTPFFQTRLFRTFTPSYLTSTEQRNVMAVTAEAYGPDHPQASALTKLALQNDSPMQHSINNPKHRNRRK
jgi:hypothetical protein